MAAALRDGGPAVPDHLVTAIGERVERAYGPTGGRARPTRRPARRLAVAWRPAISVPALAAVCAAIVIAISLGGATGGPSIAAAARLAYAPATGPAPATTSARFIDASYAGVTFPSYARFQVAPTGVRSDHIGGRPTFTVFYRLRDGVTMSYSVFSGKPVALPRNARTFVYDGVKLHEFSAGRGLAVVTLVRYGRTCVLAAPSNRDILLGLAAAPIREQQAA